MSIYGDVVVGAPLTSPQAGAELVATAEGDLDAFTSVNVRFILNTTLPGAFTYGLFAADGTPVEGKTVGVRLGANAVEQPEWRGLRLESGQRFRVLCVDELLTAVVQATINYS